MSTSSSAALSRLTGAATAAGTERYAQRFPEHVRHEFYRRAQGLMFSSVGIGSYLGNLDDATDAGYRESVAAALRGGINFVDTSLNYRHQASERNIGDAIAGLVAAGAIARDEFAVCTKAGYLVPGAVPATVLRQEDIAGGMHSLAPAFLEDQLERSRTNLRLHVIDVFYLHNPETQLQHVSQGEFYSRIWRAFDLLEKKCAEGVIRYYGAATWNGFRTGTTDDGLSLVRMEEVARKIAGLGHHFRFIQLPLNLAMLEAASLQREPGSGGARTTIQAAADLGITVVSSASLLQARLARELPDEIRSQLPGFETDAQRALQFTRSVRGVSVALVGMSSSRHVAENLKVAGVAPAGLDAWFRQNR